MPNAAASLGPPIMRGDAVHFELPVIRPVDAIQNADKRGFAGTVLPHQTVYLTASYL